MNNILIFNIFDFFTNASTPHIPLFLAKFWQFCRYKGNRAFFGGGNDLKNVLNPYNVRI